MKRIENNTSTPTKQTYRTSENTYFSMYLDKALQDREPGPVSKVTKLVKKPYGYLIHKFNTYVTCFYIKLIINSNGTARAQVREERNYCPVTRYTIYFDRSGREILGDSVLSDRQVYNRLNK